jgi:lysophospholipase L1-like esterase
MLGMLGCMPRGRQQTPLFLYNGDMEQGNDFPTAWGDARHRAVSRDTRVKHEGEASLCLELQRASEERSLEQVVVGGAGRKLTLSGWIKSEGALRAEVGVLPHDSLLDTRSLMPAVTLQRESEWQKFSKDLTLPTDLRQFSVALQAQGTGRVWIDALQLSGQGVQTIPADPREIIPPEHQEPDQAYSGMAGADWLSQHELLREKVSHVKRLGTPVVFLGDSLTQNWQSAGWEEWQRYFQPLDVLNLGMGGDRTSQILWRIQNGGLKGLQPKVVVLAVGINNLLRDTYPPEQVVKGVSACVKAVEHVCPSSKVLVIGLLPAQLSPTQPIRSLIRDVNAGLAAQNFLFLELSAHFLESDGSLKEQLYAVDGVHLNSQGYTLYRQALYPKVLKLLGN